MGCFSLAWFESLLIWLVIVAAVVAILKLLVPFVLNMIGWTGGPAFDLIMQVVKIVIWAVVIIFTIYIVFALISCLIGFGGGLSLGPHR